MDPDVVTVAMPVRNTGALKLLGLPVRVAGSDTELLLDTGSAGLRVLAAAAGSLGLERTNTPITVTFGDNTQFVGVLARAPIGIGSVTSETPVAFHLVDQVGCAPGTTSCSDRLFNGSQNFTGIIGTSLAARTPNAAVYNPLTRLPGNFDSGYIIRTGGFNATQGTFSVGLTPTSTAGFSVLNLPQLGSQTFDDGTRVWDDAALEVSYSVSTSTGSFSNLTGRTVFDTGTSDILINTARLGAPSLGLSSLPVGSQFRALLPGGFDLQLSVTNPVTPGVDRIFVDSGANIQLLGMPFFFQFDTLFDADQGRIGFLARR